MTGRTTILLLVAGLLTLAPLPAIGRQKPIQVPGNTETAQTSGWDEDSLRLRLNEFVDEGKILCSTFVKSNLDSAVLLFDSALSIKRTLGESRDTLCASLHWWIGFSIGLAGDYAGMEEPMYRALDIWHECLGPRHPENARALRVIAYLRHIEGNIWEAQRLIDEALSLFEQYPDYDLPTQGLVLDVLADLYAEKGQYREAIASAFKAMEKYQLAGHPWIVKPLQAISYYYVMAGDIDTTRQNLDSTQHYIERALKVCEQWAGSDHPHTARLYGLLGNVLTSRGMYDSAAVLLDRALRTQLATLPPDHDNLKFTYFRMARLAFIQNRWNDAVDYMEKAVVIDQLRVGEGNLNQTAFATILATYYYAAGETEKAIRTLREVIDLRLQFLESVFPYLSENLKLLYVETNSPIDHFFLSMAVTSPTNEMLEASYETVLAGKAMVLDALLAEKTVGYCVEDSLLQALIKNHNGVCTRIAELNLRVSMDRQQSGNQDAAGLYATKDSLEQLIARRCGEYEDEFSMHSVDLDSVVSSLPAGCVFWDIIRFTPWQLDADNKGLVRGPDRFLAWVITADRPVTLIDLGEAASLDSLVQSFQWEFDHAAERFAVDGERAALNRLKSVSRSLYDRLFRPLRQASPKTDRLVVSPDGSLQLLPFELMMQPDGRYVIEDFLVSYVSSGRDLLKAAHSPDLSDSTAIIIASPDYDNDPSISFGFFQPHSPGGKYQMTRGTSEPGECLSVPFDPLPGTAEEGMVVEEILRATSRVTTRACYTDEASETLVKSINPPPKLLHLATHGYFCPMSPYSDRTREENPLLNFGLALAGANRLIVGDEVTGDDGILTALEVSSLNLLGTDLVVLSCCQSGTGTVTSGEGVYGLRRAFQHAGARSVIMSMCDIPDESTTTLMERFYSSWLSGSTKASALRDASLSILNERRAEKGAAHPLFWGGFILVGDPN